MAISMGTETIRLQYANTELRKSVKKLAECFVI